MKKEIQKQMKGNRGITLIALVVTIVVLLILAGITISTLFGDNGIITAARKATDDTKQGENDVNKGLSNLEKDMNMEIYGQPYKVVEPKNVEDWEWIEDKETKTLRITKYSGQDTEVIIPNSIGGIRVKSIGGDIGNNNPNLWHSKLCTNLTTGYGYTEEKITKITISEGIEEIGWGCFGNTKNLSEVIIPNSVKKIEERAFSGCSNLTNITISDSVIEMGIFVFSDIPSITVNVPFTEGNMPDGWKWRLDFYF